VIDEFSWRTRARQDGQKRSIAEATGGPGRDPDVLESVYEDLGAALLVEVPLGAVWMVRTALAAGDLRRASRAAAAANRLASDNPGVASAAAAAAHARGLLDRDAAAVVQASAEYRHPLAKASAAEDAGVVFARAGDGDGAVAQLDQAMQIYSRAGADRDVNRVRARLRDLGVRRRDRSQVSRRPSCGWASLTETEQKVAHLVAQWLTNREVADRLFLSPHTVDSHLRQIFRKLDIRSRRELVPLLHNLHPFGVDGARGQAAQDL
jgi:DNA-binding CsgD family transcriptional regulator